MDAFNIIEAEVDDILGKYILIHNIIFKPSLRKIVPIRWIFKAIDFCKHENNLAALISRLNTIKEYLHTKPASLIIGPIESNYAELLEDYSNALLDTMIQLKNISASLCLKSQGTDVYPLNKYSQDMQRYDDLVKHYAQLGVKLNKFREKLRN